jgi:hypothetical protein
MATIVTKEHQNQNITKHADGGHGEPFESFFE